MNISRRLPSILLLLAGLFLAASVHAAPLLTNLANPTDGGYGGGPDSAQSFTTGTQPMVVTSINVAWESVGGGVNRVGFYTDNAGFPSTTQVGAFFTNPNPTVVGTMNYVGDVTLAAGTTYWIVVDITDGSQVAYTFTTTFSADPSTGGASYPAGGSAWGDNITGVWNADPANLKLALIGAAAPIPTLDQWGMIVLSLLLGLGAWATLRRQHGKAAI